MVGGYGMYRMLNVCVIQEKIVCDIPVGSHGRVIKYQLKYKPFIQRMKSPARDDKSLTMGDNPWV